MGFSVLFLWLTCHMTYSVQSGWSLVDMNGRSTTWSSNWKRSVHITMVVCMVGLISQATCFHPEALVSLRVSCSLARSWYDQLDLSSVWLVPSVTEWLTSLHVRWIISNIYLPALTIMTLCSVSPYMTTCIPTLSMCGKWLKTIPDLGLFSFSSSF